MTGKRDGRIKARKCAIGSKQRDFDGYNKANGSSSAVSTKGVILTASIDGHFGHDVAMIDIRNAFLWDDNDDEVLIKLRVKMVELLVDLDPSLYRKYVVVEKSDEPVLFAKLLKALYGFLRSALLISKKYGNN